MKISIVTIVYNDVSHIEETIKSVIQQTYQDIEYIVVDGASIDGTSEIIKKYLSHIDFYICEEDTGIYNAMNKGLQIATGDYIIFMNSGDRFSYAQVLADIINSIGHNIPAVIYGHYRESIDGIAQGMIPCRKSSMIWYGPVASHQSTFYNLKFLRQNNLYYDESYGIGADYKLTLQTITLANNSILKTDICISDFDISGASNANQDEGLADANRARREVLGWGNIRCFGMKCILLSARYLKKFANPVYNILRR